MASALELPLHDRLLVRRLEEEAAAEGSVVHSASKRRPWKGEVLAIGDDADGQGQTQPALEVQVGDKVLFAQHSGIEVKVSGEDLLILPAHEFLVVLP
jgi:chaperonin GroES